MIGHTCGMRVNVEAGLGVMVLTNGDCDTADVQTYALGLVRADRDGTAPPPPPPLPDDVPDGARLRGDVRVGGWPARSSVRAAGASSSPCRRMAARRFGSSVGTTRRSSPDADDWEPFPLRFRDGGRTRHQRWRTDRRSTSPRASLRRARGRATGRRSRGTTGRTTRGTRTSGSSIAPASRCSSGAGASRSRCDALPDGSFQAGEDPRLPERVRFEERDDGGPVSSGELLWPRLLPHVHSLKAGQ